MGGLGKRNIYTSHCSKECKRRRKTGKREEMKRGEKQSKGEKEKSRAVDRNRVKVWLY